MSKKLERKIVREKSGPTSLCLHSKAFFRAWPLPPSPSVFRYIDDFSKTKKSIQFNDEIWAFRIDGVSSTTDWSLFPAPYRGLLKRFLVWCVSQYDATTLLNLTQLMRSDPSFIEHIIDAFAGSVDDAKENWESEFAGVLAKHKSHLARAFATFLSSQSLCGWLRDDAEFLKSWNWFGAETNNVTQNSINQYRLSAECEVKIISYLQTVAHKPDCSSRNSEAAVLYWIYQHGFRPGQVATLDVQDVRIIPLNESDTVRVHATFYRAKQRSVIKRTPMRRRMKAEWAIIMASVMKDRASDEKKYERADSVFGLTPPEVSHLITNITFKITGRSISATDLRHNAAQRLADSGASHLQLAEFMGHAHLTTSLKYFDATPTQAAKVNKALGLLGNLWLSLNEQKYSSG